MFIERVRKRWDEAIRNKVGSENKEVLKFLLRHERRAICIANVCNQIQIAEKRFGSRTLTNSEFNDLVDLCADLFASAALKAKEQELLSDAARGAIEREASKGKELDALIKDCDEMTT